MDDIIPHSQKKTLIKTSYWKSGAHDPTDHLQPSLTNVKELRALNVHETINPANHKISILCKHTWKVEKIRNIEHDTDNHPNTSSDVTPSMSLERHDGKSLSSNIHHGRHNPTLAEITTPIKTSNWKSGSTWSNWPSTTMHHQQMAKGCVWMKRLTPPITNDHPVQTHVENRKYKKRRIWYRQHQYICSDATPFKKHVVGKTRRKIPFLQNQPTGRVGEEKKKECTVQKTTKWKEPKPNAKKYMHKTTNKYAVHPTHTIEDLW